MRAAVVTAAGGLTGVPPANPKIVGISVPCPVSRVAAVYRRPEPWYGYNGDGRLRVGW